MTSSVVPIDKQERFLATATAQKAGGQMQREGTNVATLSPATPVVT